MSVFTPEQQAVLNGLGGGSSSGESTSGSSVFDRLLRQESGGRQFDKSGNMLNWWTDEDRKKFKEKTAVLVQQYSAYEPVKGYHVDG